MSEVAAIIGRHQLKRLEEFVLRRNDVARLYEAELAKVRGLSLFRTPAGIRHSYYKYPVRLDDDVDREKVAEGLKSEFGVETGTVYDPPCHLHRFYRENFGAREGDLPVSENVLKKVLCLPMHVGMSRETVEYVSGSLESVIG
jgi:dTDP-4-amino-4,6-dideoxygalactose transaminase